MNKLSLLILAAAALPAQLSPDLELLTRIKRREVQQLHRQPNYTCIETVERSTRSGATRRFELLDTLRLEVALVGPKEMFAWPGSKKFEDTDITEMVGRGAIGNGSFALHARAVFDSRSATFQHRGEEHLEGMPRDAKLVRYDFDVPLLLSGYSIRVGDKKAVVPYHGSFWADPQSLDLRRMEVIADQIPRELGLASATDRMDYAQVRIGEGDFLLPTGSELRMLDVSGVENRNLMRFTACRQYSGESVISFAEPEPEAEKSAPRQIREVELPEGVDLTLELAEPVDTRSAAVGDAVQARVKSDVKHKGAVLIPRGALVSGRVSTLEHHPDYNVLGLTFTEIAGEGLHAPVALRLVETLGLTKFNMRTARVLAVNPRPGEGILYLSSTQSRLARGTLMYWRN